MFFSENVWFALFLFTKIWSRLKSLLHNYGRLHVLHDIIKSSNGTDTIPVLDNENKATEFYMNFNFFAKSTF